MIYNSLVEFIIENEVIPRLKWDPEELVDTKIKSYSGLQVFIVKPWDEPKY